MQKVVILHEQTREYTYPLDRYRFAVRIRIETGICSECSIVYWNRCKKDEGVFSVLMTCYARDNMFDYYEQVISTKEPSRYICYYFKIKTGGEDLWLNYYGIQESVPEKGLFEYSYTNEGDIFKIPQWAVGSVFYQIFPERFCNGDPSNDPISTVSWGGKPTRENYMGGDIKGIEDKLDYLKALGVGAIYLNPVFASPSNHKYDIIDYFAIDPAFGSINDLKRFVNKCHSFEIKIILDGVFNHCGYYLPQFQDVLKNGYNSRYRSWFYINGYPVDGNKLNYETIGYYELMPKLRFGNTEVRDFVKKIACFWIEEVDIDGWRLDVSDEVDYTFWHEFRKVVKSKKEECFILGETWKENRDMLRGDQMDSVMNYVFRDAVKDFFAKGCINSREFDLRIGRIIGVHSQIAQKVLYNLIGSHDTERFITACNNDIRKMKAAVAFQFTFPGIPGVYYGDEAGLTGENDPDCRKGMEWDKGKQNSELLNWYKFLIRIRSTSDILKQGCYMTNYCSKDNSVYGFYREYMDKRIYVVINNGSEPVSIKLPVKEHASAKVEFFDLLSTSSFTISPIDGSHYYNSDITAYKGTIKVCMECYQVRVLLPQNGGGILNVVKY